MPRLPGTDMAGLPCNCCKVVAARVPGGQPEVVVPLMSHSSGVAVVVGYMDNLLTSEQA